MSEFPKTREEFYKDLNESDLEAEEEASLWEDLEYFLLNDDISLNLSDISVDNENIEISENEKKLNKEIESIKRDAIEEATSLGIPLLNEQE